MNSHVLRRKPKKHFKECDITNTNCHFVCNKIIPEQNRLYTKMVDIPSENKSYV